jgi:hypothetical protein
MASTLNDLRVIGTPALQEPGESANGLRLARFCTLEEYLGLIFGVMTVAYIVMSFAALNP